MSKSHKKLDRDRREGYIIDQANVYPPADEAGGGTRRKEKRMKNRMIIDTIYGARAIAAIYGMVASPVFGSPDNLS